MKVKKYYTLKIVSTCGRSPKGTSNGTSWKTTYSLIQYVRMFQPHIYVSCGKEYIYWTKINHFVIQLLFLSVIEPYDILQMAWALGLI